MQDTMTGGVSDEDLVAPDSHAARQGDPAKGAVRIGQGRMALCQWLKLDAAILGGRGSRVQGRARPLALSKMKS